MSVEELKNLDVTLSIKGTTEAILKAMNALTGGAGDGAILDVIRQKLLEVDEAFERPLDSPEVFSKLKGTAQKAGKSELEAYCQEQIDMIAANELHFKGYTWMFYGDCVKATELLGKAAKLAPKHPLAAKDLKTAQNRLDKAMGELSKAEAQIDKNPGKSDAWTKKAVAMAAMGKLEESLQYFDKAISLDPNNPDALGKKGAVLEGLGRFSEAIPLFNRALEIKPASQIAKKGLNLADYFTSGEQ
ncbi:MAG: tetratricopeptide repeat protein [Candidatus Thermoplasmatota archaeon]|nr:tetratricopeptide repeat protein [Euryarchaeota archaeon]MBU4031527.1 tetratricopeptide repeat protein [Candidatus Thermoplasmatota archaeon]MBU4072000.1 tetratricopeptide repeat protein [Candidatus Thermoplasmatota archaeon]MBU4144531.1 tetratricopeptide repeat protein [Candidatus Thermoplasmatota archaeon]MBU4592080.1 tetratricopeptide repeat protein [Candidatus Thermoplasmatota archaeon]